MDIHTYERNHNFSREAPYNIVFSDTPQRMYAHWHSQIELMYFYSTNGCEYFCHGKNLQVQSGDLIVANPCEIHECYDFGTHASVCCLIVDTTRLPGCDLMFSNSYNNEEIRAIFNKLKNIKSDGTQYNLHIISCIYELFTFMSEFGKASTVTTKLKGLEKVFTYIENNLENNIKSHDMASIIHLSESRFYHLFREITGISPTEYILKERLKKACEFLKNTDISITESAYLCGFNSSSYFAEKFRQIYKITPREFRKRNQH